MSTRAEALYYQLGSLLGSAPDFRGSPTTETLDWLGRGYALVLEIDRFEAASYRIAMDRVGTDSVLGPSADRQILAILYRCLSVAETNAPAAARGSFVTGGSVYDAYSAIVRIFHSATSDVFIVDPYMDDQTVTEFIPSVPESVTIRLLSDEASVKSSLSPSVRKWASQYGNTRPLEARIAAARTLHDRLAIVDHRVVWILTQSLNAFAKRSHATIAKLDEEPGRLKIAAYQAMWGSAASLP